MFINLKTSHQYDGEDMYDLFEDVIWKPSNSRIDIILADSRNDDSVEMIGLTSGDALVGFAIYKFSGNMATIQYIGIRRDKRTSGLGKCLIERIQIASEAKVIVAETDDDAIGFYSKVGFDIRSLGNSDSGRIRYQCTLKKSE